MSLINRNPQLDLRKMVIEEYLNTYYHPGFKYQINDDYTVDCVGKVMLNIHKPTGSLTNGLFRFGRINGDFVCSYCLNITTLEGAPKEVIGSFKCNCTGINNLKGAPEYVGGTFDCGDNYLISIKDSPRFVGRDFVVAPCPSGKKFARPAGIQGFFVTKP